VKILSSVSQFGVQQTINNMDAAAAHLLDFSKPFDSDLLDQIVVIAMDGFHTHRGKATQFIIKINDKTALLNRVDAII
jgi:uncharacterized protein (DUF1501 family)